MDRMGLHDADRLEQHFLDVRVASDLVDEISIRSDDVVMDIGAGTGSLLWPVMLKKPRRVIAIEPDTRWAHVILTRGVADVDMRVLKCRLQDVQIDSLQDVTLVISNPPFSILNHIAAQLWDLVSLKEAYLCVGRAWFASATAGPEDDDFGQVSVILRSRFCVRRVRDISGASFDPTISGSAVWLKIERVAIVDPLLDGFASALVYRAGMRMKEFVHGAGIRNQASVRRRLHLLQSQPAVRRVQQRRLQNLTRTELKTVVSAIQETNA